MGDSTRDACKHITETTEVEQAGRGVGAGGAEQDMVGLVLAEDVVDEVQRWVFQLQQVGVVLWRLVIVDFDRWLGEVYAVELLLEI